MHIYIKRRMRFVVLVVLLCMLWFVFGFIVGKNVVLVTHTECTDCETNIDKLSEEIQEQTSESEKPTSLGVYELTAYCPCYVCSDWWGNSTSTGAVATAGRTIAVDPNVIPYGTKLTINGNTYIAEDCGGAIKGNKIDIYFDSHEEALEFGRQRAEVFLAE